MIEEFWDVQWIDGQWYNLHGSDFHVESIYGSRTNVPELRGSNIAVYGRPGQLHQSKMADQRVITLRGWVSNVDSDDNHYPGPCDQGLNTNWRRLRRLLWRENGEQFPLRRRWYGEDGAMVTAVAMASYGGGLELSQHVIEAGAWTCDLVLADPYFYGEVESVTLLRDLETPMVNFGDVSTRDITIDFLGPLGNPTITNHSIEPNVWVRLGASVAIADNVHLDVKNFTAKRDSDGANLIGAVTRSGSRPWMALRTDGNILKLTATSGAGNAVVKWRPAYL